MGAIRRAKAETSINQANDLTIFAPNNQAFNAIGSLVAGLTADELTTVLGYHVIRGKVLYSEQIVDDIGIISGGKLLHQGRLDRASDLESLFMEVVRTAGEGAVAR